MYEHVRAKARGLFNYKSNSLDLERDEIAKMRVQRRGECGWASSIHKPYRPLGTPDMLEKVKFEFLKESLKNQAAAPGKAKPASLQDRRGLKVLQAFRLEAILKKLQS